MQILIELRSPGLLVGRYSRHPFHMVLEHGLSRAAILLFLSGGGTVPLDHTAQESTMVLSCRD